MANDNLGPSGVADRLGKPLGESACGERRAVDHCQAGEHRGRQLNDITSSAPRVHIRRFFVWIILAQESPLRTVRQFPDQLVHLPGRYGSHNTLQGLKPHRQHILVLLFEDVGAESADDRGRRIRINSGEQR